MCWSPFLGRLLQQLCCKPRRNPRGNHRNTKNRPPGCRDRYLVSCLDYAKTKKKQADDSRDVWQPKHEERTPWNARCARTGKRRGQQDCQQQGAKRCSTGSHFSLWHETLPFADWPGHPVFAPVGSKDSVQNTPRLRPHGTSEIQKVSLRITSRQTWTDGVQAGRASDFARFFGGKRADSQRFPA